MEKLAKKIAARISREMNYDEDKKQVIAYGLTAFIQAVVFILLITIFGLIFGTVIEALIVCLSASLLRKYSGGAHASSSERCTAIGVVTCVLFSSISKYLLPNYIGFYQTAAITFLTALISFYIAYKHAPVDSPNKPIKSEAKIKRMRRGTFAVLFLYLVISAFFLIAGYKNKAYLSLSFSLILGSLWQIYSLTKSGKRFINLIDSAISYIFRFERR